MIKRRLHVIAAGLILSASLVATAAWAWGRDESLTQTIQTDSFTIKRPNGQLVKANVAYSVAANFYVREDGNARFPDNRSCHFVGAATHFMRDLRVTSGGQTTELGTLDKTEPAPGNQNFGDNCNTVVLNQHKLADVQRAEIGNAAKWQSDINADQAEVQRLLSLMGTVTEHPAPDTTLRD